MKHSPGSEYQDLVALVAKSFDSETEVKTGEWVRGPDGRLDMDVSIRGNIDGKSILVVIECKDYKKTRPVGRGIVDALDSKRQDLQADIAIICSNAGFTRDALNKCRRKDIGAISVISQGDKRVKAIIEKEIYFRKVKLDSIKITYRGEALKAYSEGELKYQSLPVDSWLQVQACSIVQMNPWISKRVTATFNLKAESELEIRDEIVHVEKIEISFTPITQWYSQIVQLDAALGLYDYLRERVRLTPGESRYVIKGVNFDAGTPIESPPEIEQGKSPLSVDLDVSGGFDVDLLMIEGLGLSRDDLTRIPQLEDLIIPEDLDLKIPNPSTSK